MRKFLFAIYILFLFCQTVVLAQTTDLVLDAKASSIGFFGRATLHSFHGKAGAVSGKLSLSKDSQLATGSVEIPELSLATGNKAQDQKMYAMFEAAAHHNINLNIMTVDFSGVQEGADKLVAVHGVLTMHGVSQDVLISAKARLDHGRYVCAGSFPVSLQEYKLQAPRLFFIKVTDQVLVNFFVVFVSL